MKYIISWEAQNDLEKIWLYTFERWSSDQADRYLNLIMDEIEHLCQHPYSGKNYDKLRKGYFRSKVKSHFIFYKIDKNKKLLQIIRILHERMDIDSRLLE